MVAYSYLTSCRAPPPLKSGKSEFLIPRDQKIRSVLKRMQEQFSDFLEIRKLNYRQKNSRKN